MKWFGITRWNAAVCRTLDQVPTPIGEHCPVCQRAVGESDQGFLVVDTRKAGRPPTTDPIEGGRWVVDHANEHRPWHIVCLIDHTQTPLAALEPKEVVYLATDRLVAIVRLLDKVRVAQETRTIEPADAREAFRLLVQPILHGTTEHLRAIGGASEPPS